MRLFLGGLQDPYRCLSARRRRRSGLQPYRGTGWVGRTPFGHGPAQYNPNYNQQAQYNPPPPQYTPQGGYYGGAGQNQGYFGGGQQNGVELQQPSNVYRGGEPVYEPPAGPPPSKKDNPAQ
ncbi:hypothetical protein UCRPC4_g05056 [Phaeomoniella chlamydospora]|uniref:Uncharacterized protein n=1 Tax=Phaeomoniella chlamydospora TaxID=158046 RepID=A0A0G2E770_PHACM|nr:hypothetical protein UCRPC4_g05056 [Phaeomoniella chlamydospora]